MNITGQKQLLKALICLMLAGITLAAFVGVTHCSFVALDDWVYVVDNPNVKHGFSWGAVHWALTGVYADYWIPVTWLSHILDCQLYGLNPTGHHLTNLAFHVVNVILLFLLFDKLTSRPWPSAFVALLFAIHPMHVESVAWIAERKDVLSGFFFFLTILAYAYYVESLPRSVPSQPVPTGARQKAILSTSKDPVRKVVRSRWLLYAFALLLFALGLMSKPMLVTLPFVLLLLDFWPLQRFNLLAAPTHSDGGSTAGATVLPRRSLARTGQCLLVEKIPFFLLSAFFSYVEMLAGRSGGAVKPSFEYALAECLGHVPVSYVWYAAKFAWPAHLSVFYIWHKGTTSDLEVVSASLLLLAVSAFALFRARANPYLIVGWLWFLGMLIPVIGFVQAGIQAYADRFAYLPHIGLSIIIAWGIPEMLAKVSARNAILYAGAVVIGVACFWRTVEEVAYWKNGTALLNRALTLDPNDEMAWGALGFEYEMQGNNVKALDCLKRSLSVNNHFYLAWNDLGYLLADEKDYTNAENAYQTALPLIWYKWDRMDTYRRLGDAFADDQKYVQAAAAYKNSLTLDANQGDTEAKLGECLLHSQQSDAAAIAFQTAIALQPNNADAYLGLGMISQGAGLDSDAIAQYRSALKADPDTVLALNNLAWILAADSDPAIRNGSEAVPLAEHACELTHYKRAVFIGTLADAYAEAGRFDDAVAAAQKAHDVAVSSGDNHVADRNVQLMELYKSHKAFHMGASQ